MCTTRVFLFVAFSVVCRSAAAQTAPATKGTSEPWRTPAYWLEHAERYIGQTADGAGIVHAHLACAYAAAGDVAGFKKHAAAVDGPPPPEQLLEMRAQVLAILAGGYGVLNDAAAMNDMIRRTYEAPVGPATHPRFRDESLLHILAGAGQVAAASQIVEAAPVDSTELLRKVFHEAILAARDGRKNDYARLLALGRRRGAALMAAAKPPEALVAALEVHARIAGGDFAGARQVAKAFKDDFQAFTNALIAEAQFDSGDRKAAEQSLRQALASASRFKYEYSFVVPYDCVIARVRASMGGAPIPQIRETKKHAARRDDIDGTSWPLLSIAEGYAKSGDATAFFEALTFAEQRMSAADGDGIDETYRESHPRSAHYFLRRGDAESALKVIDRIPPEHRGGFLMQSVLAAAHTRLGQIDAAATALKEQTAPFYGAPYTGRMLVRDAEGAAALAKILPQIRPAAAVGAAIGAVQTLTGKRIDGNRSAHVGDESFQIERR